MEFRLCSRAGAGYRFETRHWRNLHDSGPAGIPSATLETRKGPAQNPVNRQWIAAKATQSAWTSWLVSNCSISLHAWVPRLTAQLYLAMKSRKFWLEFWKR